MTICNGMPIIARINNKKLDVINNETFNIDEIDDEFISISNEMKNIKIPSGQFNRLFNMAYCITIHKSQGATFEGIYTIHEWGKLNTKLRYVAISRATCEDNVQIVGWTDSDCDKTNIFQIVGCEEKYKEPVSNKSSVDGNKMQQIQKVNVLNSANKIKEIIYIVIRNENNHNVTYRYRQYEDAINHINYRKKKSN
jgi:hypothetical protein